ncbi:MAG: VapC toxin family PIN domain ribonuclease [Gammaproteobacteria bacterium]|nr:VapC toxin family PIN domain ribonuclease [Gammaproteobacteria bacterium]
MTDAESLFVDTNVLIYANIAEAPFHAAAMRALGSAYQSGRPLWISRQVLREFIAVRTRPQVFERPALPATIVEHVRYFETQFNVADETAAVTAHLLRLLAVVPTGGKQIHDANIVVE